ncbi:MAG: hypothetical protein L3J16_03445, partial [Anaerolineales bacterium]|nr:hypothetical protein [Anaerolineales bacterium]
FVFLFALTSGAQAQSNYLFELEEEVVDVFFKEDGSLSLEYVFVFKNAPDAHEIDFVDVGMPSYGWRANSVSAEVNGNPVGISKDDYLGFGPGFAVVMGNYAIPAGERSTLHVYVGTITSYQPFNQDDNDKQYASAVFGTTWFGRQYLTGTSDITVSLHLPPGVQPDEPRYHIPQNWTGETTPEIYQDEEGNVVYSWHDPKANGYTQYLFGASFPKRYVPQIAVNTPPTVWDELRQVMEWNAHTIFFGGIIVIAVFVDIRKKKRKMQYLPPTIGIEGHGIKRGLTAVEAAILMGLSLDKILTMILFSLLKKGAAKVVHSDPLLIEAIEPTQEKSLRPYEEDFLLAFDDPDIRRANQRAALQRTVSNLVKSVRSKMRGFSGKETVEYYEHIMERAWEQIEAADTPEVKSQRYEEFLEWSMLDKNYANRTRNAFRHTQIPAPAWWGRYQPDIQPAAVRTRYTSPAASSATRNAATAIPQLPGADFAASVVNRVQDFSEKIIGDLDNFTANVTRKTNPLPAPISKSGGRSNSRGISHRSGRSGSHRSGGSSKSRCACACAGCACACAGGGR